MDYKDYYKIMGLKKSASQEEIKHAYRKLARKYHPDVSQETNADAKFKELGEAYEVLKDSKKRAQYDEFGQHWQQPPPNAKRQSGHNGFDPNRAKQFEDFINSVFGKQTYSSSSMFDQGQDIHARIQISLEDSYHGSEKSLQLPRSQIDPNGHVINAVKTINVKIPKGVTNKQQIRLKGQGEASTNGTPGDLYLEIIISPHPLFRLENKNVYLKATIFPWEAALGMEKELTTLGGKVSVKIPKVTKERQVIRLKGRGLPGKLPGDQYVELFVVLPETMSQEETELYRKMAELHKKQNVKQRNAS